MESRGKKMQDITDGTSNTIAVGERKTKDGGWAALWVGIDTTQGDPVTQSAIRGYTLYRMQDGETLTGAVEPDQAFSSLHPGGANFLLGDGSVRFISQSVPYKYEPNDPLTATYSKLGKRDDGQPIENY